MVKKMSLETSSTFDKYANLLDSAAGKNVMGLITFVAILSFIGTMANSLKPIASILDSITQMRSDGTMPNISFRAEQIDTVADMLEAVLQAGLLKVNQQVC
jgi:hypothetical protein